MLRFLGFMLVVTASFAAGYYFGQRPVGSLQESVAHLSERWTASQKTIADLEQSIKGVSRDVVETTTGIEKDLRRRQGLLEAKSHVIQAKTQLLERNFGEAGKELAQAGEALEQVVKGDEQNSATRELAGRVRTLRRDVAKGQLIQTKKLDEIQQALDRQLKKQD